MKDSLLKNKTFYIMLLFCLAVIGVGVYVSKNEPQSTQTKTTEKNVGVTNRVTQKKVNDINKTNNKQSEKKVQEKQAQTKNNSKIQDYKTSYKNNENKKNQKNSKNIKVSNNEKNKNEVKQNEVKQNSSLSLENKKKEQNQSLSIISNKNTNKSEKNSKSTETKGKVLGISIVSGDKIKILTDPLADGKLLKPYSIRPQYSLTLEEPKMHQAIDIQGKVGQEVHVAADGIVESIFNDHKLGTTVVVLHDKNIRTQYSNINKDVLVKKGQKMKQGDIIGVIGNTARYECMDKPHLHFSVIYANQVVDPSCYFIESKTVAKYKKDPAIDVMSDIENGKENNKNNKDSVISNSPKNDNIQYGSAVQD